MKFAFTGLFVQDEEWWIGWCPEVRGAYGQGETLDEARESLREAIQLVLDYNPIRRDAKPIGEAVAQERIMVELR